MLLPPDDNILERGFCLGNFEATIDATFRLRLNKQIVSILREHSIFSVWRYPDPTRRQFILCPSINRLAYLKIAQKFLPESMDIWRKCQTFGKFSVEGQRDFPIHLHITRTLQVNSRATKSRNLESRLPANQ